MHSSDHRKGIYNSQDMTTTKCPMTGEWMKEDHGRYTENISQSLKDWLVICSNMAGPRDCHAK